MGTWVGHGSFFQYVCMIGLYVDFSALSSRLLSLSIWNIQYVSKTLRTFCQTRKIHSLSMSLPFINITAHHTLRVRTRIALHMITILHSTLLDHTVPAHGPLTQQTSKHQARIYVCVRESECMKKKTYGEKRRPSSCNSTAVYPC